MRNVGNKVQFLVMYIRVSRFTEIFDSLGETLDWYVFCCGEHESGIQKLKKKFKVSSLENTGKWQFFLYKKFDKKFQLYKSTCETLTVDCLIIYLS